MPDAKDAIIIAYLNAGSIGKGKVLYNFFKNIPPLKSIRKICVIIRMNYAISPNSQCNFILQSDEKIFLLS